MKSGLDAMPLFLLDDLLNSYLVLLLAALVLEVEDTLLLGGVFLAGTLASGLLDGLLPPLSVPEIVHNKVGD